MRQNLSKNVIVPILLVSALSLFGAWGVVHYAADFRYLLFFAILVAMIMITAAGKKALRVGFVIWIWMFLLGYRTIYITSYFKLHPLLVLLTLLFFILLFTLKSEGNFKIKLPRILWLFGVFWIWGFIPGISRGIPWANMIADALNFFFLIPLFMIVLYLSKFPGFWKSASMTFLAAGAMICFLGTIEFYSPQFRHLLPGFIQANSEGLLSFSGFTRASFAFWGATTAIIVSALSLPLIWLVPNFYKGWGGKFLLVIAAIALGIGIYISGTRTAWLMAFVTSILLAYFAFDVAGIFMSAAIWFVASRFFPVEVWNLIFSIYTPLTSGQILDTSIQKRVMRQQGAIELALTHPFGVGWSGSGWVHGDFAQVAANLGILAGVIFLVWYVHTLYRAWGVYHKNPKDKVFQAIITSFVLCGIVLATEGAEVLPQYIMPVWFVWGLMEAYLQRINTIPEIAVGG